MKNKYNIDDFGKYVPMIKRIVKKYSGCGIADEDLFQEISLIFLKALNDYNDGYHASFLTFFYGRVKYFLPRMIEENKKQSQKTESSGLLKENRDSNGMEEFVINKFFKKEVNQFLKDLAPNYELMFRMYYGISDDTRYYPIAQEAHPYLVVGNYFGVTRQGLNHYLDVIIRRIKENVKSKELYNYVGDTGIYYPYFLDNFPFDDCDLDTLGKILPYDEWMAVKLKYGNDLLDNKYISEANEELCKRAITRAQDYFQNNKVIKNEKGRKLEEILNCSREDLECVLSFLDPTHHYYDVLTDMFGDNFDLEERVKLGSSEYWVYKNTLSFLQFLLQVLEEKKQFQSRTMMEMLDCSYEEFLEIVSSFDNNTQELLKRVFGENYLEKADITWMEQQDNSFYLFWCFEAMMFEANTYLLRMRKKVIDTLVLERKGKNL